MELLHSMQRYFVVGTSRDYFCIQSSPNVHGISDGIIADVTEKFCEVDDGTFGPGHGC